MKVGLTSKRILSVLAVVVLMAGGFAFGFVSCLHLKSGAPNELRHQYLLQTGDASSSVRVEVLAALRAFQEGYIRRDPKELDSFMNRLFPANDDILLLGTDADEWVRGYSAVAEFIRADWLKWGDFRFAVDDSIVWSTGDVAWIASVGVVHGGRADRPLRFSAILTRQGRNWVFRQVHFQWDDRDPRSSDILRASTYLKLFRMMLQHLRGTAQESGYASATKASKDISIQAVIRPSNPAGLRTRALTRPVSRPKVPTTQEGGRYITHKRLVLCSSVADRLDSAYECNRKGRRSSRESLC